MDRVKERDDRERERNYVAYFQRDVEKIMRRFRQQQGRDDRRGGKITHERLRESIDRETVGLDIGLDDSDLAIMESPLRDQTNQKLRQSVTDQTSELIATDATKQQIIEIKLAIEQLRAAGITDEEIQPLLRG